MASYWIEKDDNNYVSLSAGCESNQSYWRYQKIVDGDLESQQVVRESQDGSLFLSYDADLDALYISNTGFGSIHAWITLSDLMQGQWASAPLRVNIGGGSDNVCLGSGQAYLDNFTIVSYKSYLLTGWEKVTAFNDIKYFFDPIVSG